MHSWIFAWLIVNLALNQNFGDALFPKLLNDLQPAHENFSSSVLLNGNNSAALKNTKSQQSNDSNVTTLSSSNSASLNNTKSQQSNESNVTRLGSSNSASLNDPLNYFNSAQPVKVEVYYGPKCRDSQRFIVDQLYPVWKKLFWVMDIDINAFGKSKATPYNGGYTFMCQKGKEECDVSKMVTCGKKYIESNKVFLDAKPTFQEWHTCVIKSSDQISMGRKCAGEFGVNYSEVDLCSRGKEGQILLHEVGLKQEKAAPNLDYVPWIIINGVWSYKQQKSAEHDLLSLVCKTYSGIKPQACLKEA